MAAARDTSAQGIAFVQQSSAVPQSAQNVVTVTYGSAQSAGNLNVVVVGWNDASAQVQSVTDGRGNQYVLAVGPTVRTTVATQSIYYARNIVAAAAGGNAVRVAFDRPAAYVDVRIAEYRGLDPVAPLDVTAAATGSGTTSDSGAVTTTFANDLLIGANLVLGYTSGPGAGFVSRVITVPDADILEDRVVTTVGSFSATAATSSNQWIMQMVAFKAASGGSGPPQSPDLRLTKQHGGSFIQGQTGATYTLSVSNAGTAATSGTVTVTDALPSGLTATALTGAGWSCTLASLTCTRSDALTAGGGYSPIELTVNVAANAPATVTNTATVTGGGDANSADNSAGDVTSIAAAPPPSPPPPPGSITAPLRRSTTNPHYFIDGGGKAVYLTGSQAWNSFQDHGTNGTVRPLDFAAFVNFLRAHGHNFTLLWHIELPVYCGLPTTATSPPEFTVDTHPWFRTGPGTATDGGLKFDFTQFDQSYFDRLRSRVQQLNAAGIYAGVYTFTIEYLARYQCSNSGNPFTGSNNINGISDSGGATSATMTSPNAITTVQDAFVEKVIDTLNDLPNVVWAISEEAPDNSTWWNAHQISHIRTYEATKPFQHPIGYPSLDPAESSDSTLYNSDADWVAPKAWLSPTSSCGGGTPACKVNINDSDHSYFGLWNDTAQANRNFIWENFASGNQVLFMDPYVVYYPRENRNLCANPVNGICSAPDPRWDNFRDNMGYARTLANRVNLAAMTPQPGLASTHYTLANTNPNAAEFVVYQPDSGQFTLDLSSTSRTLNVEWLNPATGARTNAASLGGGSTRTFVPPFSGDAVLYVYDQSLGVADTTPPSAPTDVSAAAVSASQINLTWTASTDNVAVAGYRIFRGGIQAGTSATNAYSDTGLSPSTTYSYTVVAYDASNNVSAPSQGLSVTTAAGSLAPVTFVQLRETRLAVNASSISTGAFASPVGAGNLIVIWVWYSSSVQSVASVTDTLGNVYARAVGPTTGIGTMASWRQELWYAKNVAGGAGASVTAAFTGSFAAPKAITAHEYSGVDPTAPLDAAAAAAVSGANVSSGPVTTTSPNELLFGAALFEGAGSAGPGFTQRSSLAGNVSEDQVVSATGSYAVRFVNGSQSAIVQIATFRAASAPPQAGSPLSVIPRTSVLTPTLDQQFAVSGGNGGTVSWTVDGVSGGSATTGTISTDGLYSPPNQAGTHVVAATNQAGTASATVYVTTYAGTFTHHNDKARTGQNPSETVLTPANVNASKFGKLFSYALDGMSMASPLYVAGVTIPGQGVRNVVYVATQHDSVYAFDADGLSLGPLWHASFLGPSVTTVPAADTGECCDISSEIGITGTPVIDPATNTLYVVAKTKEGPGTYVQRLHALDLGTGAEKQGGPVTIQATAPGNGSGSFGGQVRFDPLHENQRPALLLNNGVVYIAFGSHGDQPPYHGWVLGYNASTLQQVMAINVSPNAEGGGIWQANGGPAADAAGNIYVVTGNGTFDANTNGRDFGDSFLKITPAGAIADYFTPWNQGSLNANGFDLGAAGPLLLPDQPGTHPHLLVSAGKNNTIYLVDRDAMGHYSGTTNDNQIVQSLVNVSPNGTPEPGNFSAPVYFNGTVYFGPVADSIQAFSLSNGRLSITPLTRSADVFKYPGATLAISANGASNGIVWAIQRNGDCGVQPSCGSAAAGVLKAYDALNLGTLLYSSDQMGARDVLDFATKFSVPLVANGKVFVGSMSYLTAYGLLP